MEVKIPVSHKIDETTNQEVVTEKSFSSITEALKDRIPVLLKRKLNSVPDNTIQEIADDICKTVDAIDSTFEEHKSKQLLDLIVAIHGDDPQIQSLVSSVRNITIKV